MAQGKCLKKCRERPGNRKPACMNSTMPPAPSFPLPPSLPRPPLPPPPHPSRPPHPLPGFPVSVSEIIPNSKTKIPSQVAKKTPVKSNNPPTKLQAVLLSQPTPPTLLRPGGHCVHSSVSKKGTALPLDLSFSKHLSQAVSPAGSLWLGVKNTANQEVWPRGSC